MLTCEVAVRRWNFIKILAVGQGSYPVREIIIGRIGSNYESDVLTAGRNVKSMR